ncbi:uncharacterized protein LOC129769679 [Toxorhynchites rutilus septentrionalis]|uniref:uncharacterized protein LOC129769679 n=1 Tax=Toxorhynchites rutilus septentrionalis TaxID=329112 RepID=UPI00247A646D|nr:uncharacterized protein LOC129769679 [Toxorhynchites rutilus septentrionalis]
MSDTFIGEEYILGDEQYIPGSASAREEKQETLRAFIEQYEAAPELWDPTNPKYTNKMMRDKALDRLLPFLARFKLNANRREDVKDKINSLRTNYRKELVRTKKPFKGTGEPYTPSSWVFYALSFLEPALKSAQRKSKADATADHQDSEQLEDAPLREEENDQHVQQTPAVDCTPSKTRTLSTVPSPQKVLQTTTKRQRSQSSLKKQKSPPPKRLLESPSPAPHPNHDGSIPTIAKAWGEKLSTLDSTQRVFAEKAINDILFEASLGTLHRKSVQINAE